MVAYCFVEGCKSTKYKRVKEDNNISLTFFGFPKDPVWREKWIKALINSGHTEEQVAKISRFSRICSLHFSKDCIGTIGLSNNRLKPNSVPTIFPNAPEGSVAKIENVKFESSNESSMKTETVSCEDESCQASSNKRTSVIEIEAVAQCEDEICQAPSNKRTSVEIEIVAQCEDDNCQISSKKQTAEIETSEIETVAQYEDEIYRIPKKRIHYAGDINLKSIENMTPKMLVKSLNILKKSCVRKDTIINRLRLQHSRQKKKIESLEAILSNFREKNIRSRSSTKCTGKDK